MKILILHTLPPERCAGDRWEWEFDLQVTVTELLAALPDAVVAGVRGEPVEMMGVITREQPSVVINLCEAPLCDPRLEPHAAALLEWLRIPFTGSRSDTLALCRRKDLTKNVLQAAGVRVPLSGRYPCIVKPLDEDGSAGIYVDSVCHTASEVERAKTRLSGRALVEEFLPGREFVVSMWGQSEPEHAVVGEIAFTDGVQLVTYEGKWDMESHGYVNAPLVLNPHIPAALHHDLVDAAQAAWRAMGLRGYGTVDLRLTSDGHPCVLDVNPNAAINADSRLTRSVYAHGWTWQQFLQQQLEWAF
jgi:D-alanine-D-alanine ligase